MGYVTTTGRALTKTAEVEQQKSDGSYEVVTENVDYYLAETNDNKKNKWIITATPATHTNNQNQNKWEFDHWDLDGEVLYQKDGNGNVILDSSNNPILLGSTIAAETLVIPKNGSVLTAHFKQKSSSEYVVPDREKQGSTITDMSEWLEELLERDLPLDKNGCKKTAEVYDYENRIYRVDLTSKSSLLTFAGTIDLGFMLDVSASMLFPSKLTGVSGKESVPIYKINGQYNWNYGTNRWEWADASNKNQYLDTSKTYYLIGDDSNTATVFRIFFYNNYWYAVDASKYKTNNETTVVTTEKYGNTTRYVAWIIGKDDHKNSWNDGDDDGKYCFHKDDTVNSTYKIYEDGDNGLQRVHYLKTSMSNTIANLNQILGVLSVANNDAQNPDVKIAYNTFCKTVKSWNPDFTSASSFPSTTFDSITTDGGTHTDWALADDGTEANRDWSANKFNWEQSATKYAILITDGAPQASGSPISSNTVKNKANILKAGND